MSRSPTAPACHDEPFLFHHAAWPERRAVSHATLAPRRGGNHKFRHRRDQIPKIGATQHSHVPRQYHIPDESVELFGPIAPSPRSPSISRPPTYLLFTTQFLLLADYPRRPHLLSAAMRLATALAQRHSSIRTRVRPQFQSPSTCQRNNTRPSDLDQRTLLYKPSRLRTP
jgi:hypothetical protein